MASHPTRLRLPVSRLAVTCESLKVSYITYDAAWDAAERAMDKGLVEPGCHLTPYRCEQCGTWHVRNRRIVWPAGTRPRRRKEPEA